VLEAGGGMERVAPSKLQATEVWRSEIGIPKKEIPSTFLLAAQHIPDVVEDRGEVGRWDSWREARAERSY
jgi:hypothetical protein